MWRADQLQRFAFVTSMPQGAITLVIQSSAGRPSIAEQRSAALASSIDFATALELTDAAKASRSSGVGKLAVSPRKTVASMWLKPITSALMAKADRHFSPCVQVQISSDDASMSRPYRWADSWTIPINNEATAVFPVSIIFVHPRDIENAHFPCISP